MRRRLDRSPTLVLLALLAVALLTASPAAAQNVDAAVNDLRDNDVTFEEGAVSGSDLDDLDEAAQDLRDDEGYFKVVVLADRVEDYPSTSVFAQRVLDGLGGRGRVLVYDPASVGIASNVDSAAEVAAAESAVVEEANRTNSFAEGALAGGEALTGVDPTDDDDGGGGAWVFWLLLLGGGLLLVFFLISRARRQAREQEASLERPSARARRCAAPSTALRTSPDLSTRSRHAMPGGRRRFTRRGRSRRSRTLDTHAELEAVRPSCRGARGGAVPPVSARSGCRSPATGGTRRVPG